MRPPFFCGFLQNSNIFCTCTGKCGAFLRFFAKAQYICACVGNLNRFFADLLKQKQNYILRSAAKCARYFYGDGFSIFCAVCCNLMSQFFVGHFTELVLTLVSEYCTQHFFILERLFLNPNKNQKIFRYLRRA